MKLVCTQVIKNLLGSDIDYDKIHKLTADAKFEIGDIKASIAALAFIVSSAAKYDVQEESLSNELQQLGLPKEHSTSLCKSYKDNQAKLQEEFKKQSLKLSQLEAVNWRVDYILGSSEVKEINQPAVQLQLTVKNPDDEKLSPVAFTVSSDKFRVLLHELKQAYSMMENLKS